MLSPANREFMESQKERSEQQTRKTIILGGETFTVNEDLNVIDECDEEAAAALSEAGSSLLSDKRQVRMRKQPELPAPFVKRDSNMSINSSCSVDSDWSEDDGDLEEIERLIDDLNEKAEQRCEEEGERGVLLREAARARWETLKRSRSEAINRVKVAKKLQRQEVGGYV